MHSLALICCIPNKGTVSHFYKNIILLFITMKGLKCLHMRQRETERQRQKVGLLSLIVRCDTYSEPYYFFLSWREVLFITVSQPGGGHPPPLSADMSNRWLISESDWLHYFCHYTIFSNPTYFLSGSQFTWFPPATPCLHCCNILLWNP